MSHLITLFLELHLEVPVLHSRLFEASRQVLLILTFVAAARVALASDALQAILAVDEAQVLC